MSIIVGVRRGAFGVLGSWWEIRGAGTTDVNAWKSGITMYLQDFFEREYKHEIFDFLAPL